jgi:hypothetical protein
LICFAILFQWFNARLRSIVTGCEQWKLDDLTAFFDSNHPDYPEVEATIKRLPDKRNTWQTYWKDIQQIAGVAKCSQSAVKQLATEISQVRSNAAQVVACAVMAEIVLHQSQYKNAGTLNATLKAGMKQAASMGVSGGDLPLKLRSFIESLLKDSSPALEKGSVVSPSKEAAREAAQVEENEGSQDGKRKRKHRKKEKKATDEVEDSSPEAILACVCRSFTSVAM